jgi:hypothetical protein
VSAPPARGDYGWRVDREAIARVVRRRQAQEALEFEQQRAQTLQEQIELVIGEVHGPTVDAAAFARMTPDQVELVRAELDPPPLDVEEDAESFFERDDLFDDYDLEPIDPHEEELGRLRAELEVCRRRQQAFEAYLAALGG